MNEKPQDAPEGSEKEPVKFLDLFDPRQPRSDQELIEARLEVCNACEWIDKRMMKCRKCGCFMYLKSTLKQASCPLGKW